MACLRALVPVLLLLLAGCTSPSPSDPSTDAVAGGGGAADAPDEVAPAPTPAADPVTDPVSFAGTLGAHACWFDGSSVSCANIAGSNVLVYQHARTGRLTGGELTVSFSPAPGTGPATRAYIADGCPDACRVVQELADNRPALDEPPVGTGASYLLHLPEATILANQTLVVRIAPLLLTSVASVSPTYEVEVAGELGFA